MLNFFKHSNFLSSRVISGVEITTGSTNVYSYCQIKNYYGTISIRKEQALINSIEELNQLIGKNKAIPFSPSHPLSVAITGKKVLIKTVEAKEDEEDNIILQKALPGAKSDRFYVQKYWNQTNWIVAVIKKELLDEILTDLQSVGLECIAVVLGPLSMLPFTEESKELNLPHYQITNKNQVFELKQQTNEIGRTLDVDGETISFQNIIAFSAAISHFSKDPNLEELTNTSLQKTIQEVKFNIYQVALLRLFFILVLFISLTNYFLSQAYQNSLIDLQEITADQQAEYSMYEQKQKELNQRISILKTTGVSSFSNLSFYADQIAAITPKSISLLDLNIGLLERKMKEDEKLNIKKNEIYIKGIANETLELNEFVLKLENENWIAKSVIQNYDLSNRENPGLFEIKINLNE